MKNIKNCKIITLLAFIFISFSFSKLYSQNFIECAFVNDTTIEEARRVGCENTSSTWIHKYRTPGYWIPNSSTPIKTIMVNWVICRDNNGQNGWQNTPALRSQVDEMFVRLNEWYSNSLPKGYTLTCEPNYIHVSDTRIRFELNELIFIDSTFYNQSCWAASDGLIDYIHKKYPGSENFFTHIFTQPDSTCFYNAWGYYSNCNNNKVAYVQTWGSMWDPWYVVWDDHIHHIAHEYGHAVGLDHTYNSEQRLISHHDFLDDVFGLCAETSCPCGASIDHICYLTKECFWNHQAEQFYLMSGVGSPRYISPKAAGRMHRALSMYNNSFQVNNMPMHMYVKEKYSFETPLTIMEDEIWDFAIKMYQDVIIESGKTLTITCEVKMPINGKIIVRPGGRLIINEGNITSAHNHPWHGIEVWGDKTAHQFPDANGNYQQGYLELNNATIENAICAVNLWRPDHWSSMGAL